MGNEDRATAGLSDGKTSSFFNINGKTNFFGFDA